MKRIKIILGSVAGVLTLLPTLAFAQNNLQLSSNGISGILVQFGKILEMIVPLLIALAVIGFLYGVMRFVFSAGDDEARKAGKNLMIYGLIGIVVMVSIWGLVRFAQNTFGISGQEAAQAPSIPLPR